MIDVKFTLADRLCCVDEYPPDVGNRQTDRQMDGWIDRQADGLIDRRIDRWIDRQLNRQTDR